MTANHTKHSLKTFNLVALVAIFFTLFNFSSATAAPEESEGFNPNEVIMHHVVDSHVWHFFEGHHGTLFLPVIVYSDVKGFEVFSSGNFYDEHHNLQPYNGYVLNEEGHIELADSEAGVLDLSITKNVAMLLINAALMIFIFMAVAKGYKKNAGKAPKGIQSFFEPVIIFIKDEVVKPNIGKGYEKYLPYLLTLFFFILFGNLLGLLPGAGNLTGNIAVTMTLAVLTFIITNVSGNKHYWKHIFNTPGVPWWLKFPVPMMPLVEFIGMFTKPFALMIRLFVAITAGHIVILSLISLTFIFSSYTVGVGSTIIVLFINLIELLVAAIQAYVFTMFSALYIGLATEEHEHDDHHVDKALA